MKSSQKNIKIDSDVKDELAEWIETGDAKKKGFNSMARVATIAIREFMDKHKKERFEHLEFDGKSILLIDNEKPKGNSYVKLFFKNNTLVCNSCESSTCIHISACWDDSKIKKILESEKIKSLS